MGFLSHLSEFVRRGGIMPSGDVRCEFGAYLAQFRAYCVMQ